ncbi:MAG TPA: class I SAM-dependent methyltransferase [Gammaproteobacteria bacterium]|jgi:cyclopropane fatty-acyl-phospholipid synthase-like methyltransferase
MKNDYTNYTDWKHWHDFGALTPSQAAYLARELSMLAPLRGKRILEVGFGNGSFLGFARREGVQVHGTEVIPELVQAAREAGFEVSAGDAAFRAKQNAASFDAVIAFDVLEHMDKSELPAFFSAVHGVLKPDGVFLARFPNGDSPFGRRYQHGDLTHKTVIGSGMVRHLAAVSGFEVTAVRNPRTEYLSSPLVKLAQLVQRGLRNLVELLWGYVFFSRRLAMDQNLVAHLVKRTVAPVKAAVMVPGAPRGSRPRQGPRRATGA